MHLDTRRAFAVVVRACVEAPNGSRLWVRRCRVQRGVLWTSEAESLTESEHSRGRRRGALPPNGVFIFCASTLSCLHLSSGSWLLGLPLIPLDAPLSPPGSRLCMLSGSFLHFPSVPLLFFLNWEFIIMIDCCKILVFHYSFRKKKALAVSGCLVIKVEAFGAERIQ